MCQTATETKVKILKIFTELTQKGLPSNSRDAVMHLSQLPLPAQKFNII